MAGKTKTKTVANASDSPHFVSVIICTQNAISTLRPLLMQVMEQNYPQFECIVVDDGSTDGTAQWLHELSQEHSNLVNIYQAPDEKKLAGKKEALEKGILAATGDMILLTDADCRLSSKDWITNMVLPNNVMTNFVIGFAPLQSSASLASKMGSLESLLTAMQYGSWAQSGLPYMGVGRNMAYSKHLIAENSPLVRHKGIPSGDDDLFVQDMLSRIKVEIQTEPGSIVYSDAPKSWKAWYRQKSRHVQTSLLYDYRHKVILGLFALSHLLFYEVVLVGLFIGYEIEAIMALCIRWLILYLPYRNWARLINFGPGWKLYPFFDLFLSLYYVILFPGLFFKRKTW